MNFPHHDIIWSSVRDFLLALAGERARILAPADFGEIFPNTVPYRDAGLVEPENLDALVLHKGRLPQVGEKTCLLLVDKGLPLFGNEVFVVFSLKGRKPGRIPGEEHFEAFYEKVRGNATFLPSAHQAHAGASRSATAMLAPLPANMRNSVSFSGMFQKARRFLRPRPETVFLKQYGERRTGTNFLRAILLYNYSDAVLLMHVLGDKHSPPVDFDSCLKQANPLANPGWEFVNRATSAASAEGVRDDDPPRLDHMRKYADALARSVEKKRLGFLISLKHPYAWAASLARYSDWMSEIDGLFQMNPIHGERLRKACVDYNGRHAAWLALHARNRHRSVLVRYEELLEQPDRVIADLEKKFGLRRPAGPLRLPGRKVHPAAWDQDSPLLAEEVFDPDFYKLRRYQERLRKELWEIVVETIDWKLMERCGYRQTPLPF